jgi:hypothetical protein
MLARKYLWPLVDCVNEIGLTGQTSLKTSGDRPQYAAAKCRGKAAGQYGTASRVTVCPPLW